MRRIPYVYHRPLAKKPWRVFVRWGGVQMFVGDFDERTNAFVEYNRVMSELGVGLLPLQRGLSKKKLVALAIEARVRRGKALELFESTLGEQEQ